MKEIHQADLKPFRNLTHLQLSHNVIEIIEEGLFEYNQKLEVLGVYESNIIHIDPNVLNNLNNLNSFLFKSVPCIDLSVYDPIKIKAVIELTRKRCANSEYLLLDEEIKNLEIESKALNFGDFN